jgi:competence/damage-inducible protein CinA C-terminal domain
MMSAEIVAIGSELLTPQKTDTNSLWLTEKLNDIGVEVMLKTVVGDDELRLEEVIRDALKRSDIVITTGGLGPTEDDVSRQVSARAVDRELVYHDDIERHLRERFKAWGREMPEINKRQAYVIDGAEILPNPNGSAVGMLVKVGEKILAVLPGPPREMKPMFGDHVLPRIRERSGDVLVQRRVIKVSGLGESAVDEAVAPIYKAYSDVQTSILFNKSEVEIHLLAKSHDAVDATRKLAEIADQIQEKLGKAVFSSDGESMEQVIGRMLRERGETIAVAESCTGGLIGMRLTEVPGSSGYFREGAVTYSNEAKIDRLGVPEDTIANFGAVSVETAEAMAAGMRETAKTDHAISITGIAGPDGGTEDKPVGTVCIGYSGEQGTRSVRMVLPGDRYLVRWRSSQAALDLLRRQLLKASV